MSKRYREEEAPDLAKRPKMKEQGESPASIEIDEDLHSRQLAVYGKDSMRRMACSHILICGALGLGVEAAKNVVLSGVRAVTLHDPATVCLADLSAQFYLNEADVGKNRAEACSSKLQDLNYSVQVSSATGLLTPEFISQFQVVLATDLNLEDSVKINDFCHKQNIAFIRAEVRGVFASVFCDFGPRFRVFDSDGEEPQTAIIAGITPGRTTFVSCVEDDRLGLQDGQIVVFSEIQGMDELNDGRPRKVKNCKAHSFEIEEDSTAYSTYQKGGLATQVKETKHLSFRTLKEALRVPGDFMISDFSKLDRPGHLHVGFQALDAFQAQNSRLPHPYDASDAEDLLKLAEEIAPDVQVTTELDFHVLKKLAYTAAGQIGPINTLMGGIVGQEILKAASGKFHPLYQWLYFDAVECLPDNVLLSEEVAPMGSRYDQQIAIFGRSLQHKLEALKVFLVGAGALGCEFLKNFAMMGLSIGSDGQLTVTDDDVIEKSNLSRQFLFRDWDIGRPKSTVACQAATALNAAFRPIALQTRVSPVTEGTFHDNFWEGLDIVVNALDNVSARLYVDSRCVYFKKPLLESGTLGPKCNTQVIVPYLTENYGASRDPPEKQAPMCTVHSFPHNIDHCLSFARSEFEGMLEKAPAEANAYLADPAKYVAILQQASDAAASQQLQMVYEVLSSESCITFTDCIAWARRKFEHQFHDRIAQLIYTFPEDAVTSTGSLFWSPPKRFPRPLKFDVDDPSHVVFCQAAAILKAQVHCIKVPNWATDLKKVAIQAADVVVPAFHPQQGVKIETDPAATIESTGVLDDSDAIKSLIKDLERAQAVLPKGFRLQPITFEKDDDDNFHMDLISSLANMRARNYAILEIDKFKAKIIAGKIIPAIATATAVATGLVCLELYKVIQHKELQAYRNTFANLALPLIAMAEPVSPKAIVYKDQRWSMWDRWVLQGNLTVQELLDWFRAKGLEAYSISCGQSLLYNNIFPKHKDRLTKKLSELVQAVAKMDIPKYRNHFDIVVACEDADGEDLDVPLISIQFR